MTSMYGNIPVELPGVSPEVVKIAADRLMPPQYEEFCEAMQGETSCVTAAYWREKAEMWQEQIDEIRGEEEE